LFDDLHERRCSKIGSKTQATPQQRAYAMNKQDKSRRVVAEALGVNIRTADLWRWDRKRLGKISLCPRKQGRKMGTLRNLTPGQDEQIQKKIAEKPPIVRLLGNRFSSNMISSVTNQGKARWLIYRDTLNSKVFIRFLDRLSKDASRKVFLIVDNLRFHHGSPVKEWSAQNAHRIELHFLPSYSPECNPGEYLNCSLKGRQMPLPADRKELEFNLKTYMHKLNKKTKHVASYFDNQFVTYPKAV